MILKFLPCLLLTGCVAAPVVLTGTSLAVSETTGKTITDHAVSSANGKDCKIVRYFKDEPVCQEAVKTSKVRNRTVEEIERAYARK